MVVIANILFDLCLDVTVWITAFKPLFEQIFDTTKRCQWNLKLWPSIYLNLMYPVSGVMDCLSAQHLMIWGSPFSSAMGQVKTVRIFGIKVLLYWITVFGAQIAVLKLVKHFPQYRLLDRPLCTESALAATSLFRKAVIWINWSVSSLTVGFHELDDDQQLFGLPDVSQKPQAYNVIIVSNIINLKPYYGPYIIFCYISIIKSFWIKMFTIFLRIKS